jgi:hypothetical protein
VSLVVSAICSASRSGIRSKGHLGVFVCDMVCSPHFGYETNNASDAKQFLHLLMALRLQIANKFVTIFITWLCFKVKTLGVLHPQTLHIVLYGLRMKVRLIRHSHVIKASQYSGLTVF